ncbi:Nitrogen permease regulator 2 [Onygenales sp. PD_40]|nr:Nitrogen permease regulator 2 [Onygenales sp. PD_40]
MIKAIFYSKFDTQEGPKVVHQVPDGSIVPSPTAPPNQPPLLTFSDISFFVIPRQELCGNLIHVCSGGYRILGSPVCLTSPRYDRNEFIFNFCIVLAEEEEFGSYKSVVQKLAHLMCGLEEQSGFLSRDFSKGGEGKVHSLCETLMEDLNNYCECMIPIDELNTLNIKLFPIYPSPPMVKAWQVPLFTVRYEAFMDENWDLTMQRIVPYINGVNSVRIIAALADTDFSLTCNAIRHLLYYGCVFLLDIFSFTAIYAPTAQFSSTIPVDEDMQRECARYVNTRFAPSITTPPTLAPSTPSTTRSRPILHNDDYEDEDSIWPLVGSPANGRESSTSSRRRSNNIVDGVGLVELYASLRQGLTVKQWYIEHTRELANIDLRRFITFGVIKGFLYRVHKYAYATGYPAAKHQQQQYQQQQPHRQHRYSVPSSSSVSSSFARGKSGSIADVQRSRRSVGSRDGGESVVVSPTSFGKAGDDGDEDALGEDEEEEDFVDDRTLGKYLDGTHCFDQICTELEVSEKELVARLRRYPCEVQVIDR